MGVDAVEPDVVATRDGVLVIRHENEISGTTDVAQRPEFAGRRTTKVIDGERLTGWFTEDFTWDELASLTCRERISHLRPASAAWDGLEPIMRLRDLLAMLEGAEREVIPVIEVKHATHFSRVGLDLVPLLVAELEDWPADRQLVIESFEQEVLTRLRDEGVAATFVYLMEDTGTASDVAARGGGLSYAEQYSAAGMDALAGQVDGLSFDKETILRTSGEVVRLAHDRGLRVFTWTCRPENAFLAPQFRTGAESEFGNYEQEWAEIADTGVDGVFVDHADLGVAFFGVR